MRGAGRLLPLLGAGLRAGESGAAAGLLLGTGGAAATAAAAAVGGSNSLLRRGFAIHVDPLDPKEHAHHHFADSHRPDEEVTYSVGEKGRVVSRPVAAPRRQQFLMAQRAGMQGPEGPPPAALQDVAAQLGVVDPTDFVRKAQRLAVERQHALLSNAAGVAESLQGLGIGGDLIARMMQHCPALFSYPSEERAEVLMSELMGENVGKSAEQAGELFVRCPALANTRHIMPSIARVVAAQHGDD